jgi:hypothetical protein
MQQLLTLETAGAGSEVRRSMRLLDCYLPRREDTDRPSSAGGSTQQPQQQQHQRQRPKSLLPGQHKQQQWQGGSSSILQQAGIQQQQHQPQQQQQTDAAAAGAELDGLQQQAHSRAQQGSRLNPAKLRQEESSRAMQIQKLQVSLYLQTTRISSWHAWVKHFYEHRFVLFGQSSVPPCHLCLLNVPMGVCVD